MIVTRPYLDGVHQQRDDRWHESVENSCNYDAVGNMSLFPIVSRPYSTLSQLTTAGV
jgi:hypothetical protein